MSAPLIAVTGPARLRSPGFGFCAANLRYAGARVRRLRPPYRPDQLCGLSGVVVGGGAHIDPTRYAEEPIIDYEYDRSRDELEWRVLDAAFQQRLPVLGICRGAQLINVFFGGTLTQDLAHELPGQVLKRSVLARKHITIERRTRLAEAMGVIATRVNSLHSQAIRRLGRGLDISARDSHGLVQAVESEPGAVTPWLGVQWHPEYLMHHRSQRRLFQWLVKTAARAVTR